jgi:hypothetical protein
MLGVTLYGFLSTVNSPKCANEEETAEQRNNITKTKTEGKGRKQDAKWVNSRRRIASSHSQSVLKL